MNQTVGTCGNCGGRVSVPESWLSTVPPVPACERCGATVAQPHGPVIEMTPPAKKDSR
jgi:ribosomal protein S27E